MISREKSWLIEQKFPDCLGFQACIKITENGTGALPAAPLTGSGAVVGCECAPGKVDPTPPDTIFEQNVQTWGHFGRPVDVQGLHFGRHVDVLFSTSILVSICH